MAEELLKLEGLDELPPIAAPTKEQPEIQLEGLEELPPVQQHPQEVQLAGLEDLPPVTHAPEKDYYSLTETLVSDQELKALSTKHGVPMELLKSRVSLYGGIPEGGEIEPEEIAKGLFGTVSETILFSLPQWIDKKMQDPKVEQALDALRESIQEKKKGTLLGQAEDVSQFIAGATTGAKLGDAILGAKAIGTGLQTGLSSLGESKRGEEIKDFATGATFGVAGYGAFKGIGKLFSKVKGKEVPDEAIAPKNYVPEEDVGFNLDKKVKDRLYETSQLNEDFLVNIRNLSYGNGTTDDLLALPEEQFGKIAAFSKFLGADVKKGGDLEKNAKKIMGALKQWSKGGEGEEALLEEAMSFRYKQEARKILQGTLKEDIPEAHSNVRANFDKILGAESVSRMADRKWGTNLATTHTKLSKSLRDYGTHLGMKAQEFKPLQKVAEKVGLSEEDLYQFLDKGVVPKDAEQAKVAQSFRQFFQDARDEVNTLGMDIKYRENYVPHVPVDEPEMVTRIRAKADELGFKGFTKDGFKEQRKSELFKAMEILKGSPINNAESANSFLKILKTEKNPLPRLRTKAGAAFAREGEIPEFIREKEINKLTNKWLTNTYKHAYLRDNLRELKTVRDAIGDKDPALKAHLEALMVDITGGLREGTLSSATRQFAQDLKDKYQPLVDATNNPLKKGAYKMAANAPDVLSFFIGQAYPNFLGMNPKSLITNLTQPLTTTIPEIGYTYAAPKAVGAYADFLRVATQGTEIVLKDPLLAKRLGKNVGDTIHTRFPSILLQNEGMLGKEAHTEIKDVLRGNIAKNKFARGAQVMHEASTDLAMGSYAATETVNRFAAYKMGQSIGEDLVNALARGDTSLSARQAKQFYDKLASPAHKRAIAEAINAGKPEMAKNIISEYLIGKTIYNYDKASAAQFARSAGPMFSMFTKFPTAVLGDMVEIVNRDGATAGSVEIARKYAAPVILLAAIDKAVFGGEEREGIAELTLGKTAPLSNVAPGTAVIQLATEGYKPPVVEIAQDAYKALTSMDEEQWDKFMLSLAKGYVPGAVWARAYKQVGDAMED